MAAPAVSSLLARAEEREAERERKGPCGGGTFSRHCLSSPRAGRLGGKLGGIRGKGGGKWGKRCVWSH